MGSWLAEITLGKVMVLLLAFFLSLFCSLLSPNIAISSPLFVLHLRLYFPGVATF